jgi:RsiW-degrading membrane proteinase PrsW (M82 family)
MKWTQETKEIFKILFGGMAILALLTFFYEKTNLLFKVINLWMFIISFVLGMIIWLFIEPVDNKPNKPNKPKLLNKNQPNDN